MYVILIIVTSPLLWNLISKKHVFRHFDKKKIARKDFKDTISTRKTVLHENMLENGSTPDHLDDNNITFDYNEVLKGAFLSDNTFIIQLHSNNNYCRSDIISLQKSISLHIITPIFNLLDNCLAQKDCIEKLVLYAISALKQDIF